MPIFNRYFRDVRTGNPLPEAMAAIGAVVRVEVNLPQPLIKLLEAQGQAMPPASSGMAVIDTGASKTCVNEAVLMQLGINPIGVVSVGTPAGRVERGVYPARLDFPELRLNVELSSVVAVDLGGQVVTVGGQSAELLALIGRDILRLCYFTYNGAGGTVTLAY